MLQGKQPSSKYKKRMMISMAKKSGTQEWITFERVLEDGEIKEIKYMLQHPGVRKGVEIQNSVVDMEKNKLDMNIRNEQLMKYVIRKEDLTPTNWDYWEEVGMEEFKFVLETAAKFLGGENA